MSFRLYCGDALDVLRGLPDASLDALVTDPPAGRARLERAAIEHGRPAGEYVA